MKMMRQSKKRHQRIVLFRTWGLIFLLSGILPVLFFPCMGRIGQYVEGILLFAGLFLLCFMPEFVFYNFKQKEKNE